MKFFRIKTFLNIIAILLLLGLGYYYREDIGRFGSVLLNRLQPCQRPITYSLAELDPRFGLTRDEVLSDITKAEEVWELPIDKQLFEYSPTGDLKISLIYDSRQQATDDLRKMGIVINDDQATYDRLKAKYDSFVASYNKTKAQIEILTVTYESDRSAYEKDVNYWNKKGGASKSDYNILEQRRADLDNQITIINQIGNSLNDLVDKINSTATILNKLVNALNLQVDNYNTIGGSNGEQFNEGEYKSDASGVSISIFQFNDERQLVRVLAHELGHALGLGHIDNSKAVMYYLNEEGMSDKLTADDLVALRKQCGIK